MDTDFCSSISGQRRKAFANGLSYFACIQSQTGFQLPLLPEPNHECLWKWEKPLVSPKSLAFCLSAFSVYRGSKTSHSQMPLEDSASQNTHKNPNEKNNTFCKICCWGFFCRSKDFSCFLIIQVTLEIQLLFRYCLAMKNQKVAASPGSIPSS